MGYLSKQLMMIFCLKAMPYTIPYSRVLVLLLLSLSFFLRDATNLLFVSLINKYLTAEEAVTISVWHSSLVVGIALLLMGVCIYSVLTFYHKQNRLMQVFAVMLGVDIIFSICFIVWMGLFYISPAALLLFIILLYWQFMVHIHIFVHSFDINMLQAGAFALIYILLQHNIAEWLMNIFVQVG